ncbi:MAG TPA: hypothetical protein VMR50_10480 [Myxococcota bacterium]|nr:hypothetical protein [Myxococcota bacterium]
MKKSLWILSVVLGFANPSGAATVLTTAPFFTGHTTAYCNVVNVSKRPVTVVIEVMNYDGTTVTTTGPVTLDPGHLFEGVGAGSWCRFTVNNGSAKSVRAAGTLADSTLGLATFPAN